MHHANKIRLQLRPELPYLESLRTALSQPTCAYCTHGQLADCTYTGRRAVLVETQWDGPLQSSPTCSFYFDLSVQDRANGERYPMLLKAFDP